MSLELSDYRWSALKRYHDKCLELVLSLTVFSLCPVHSHDSLGVLSGPRFSIRMINEMHEFCYNARKSIEIAEKYKPGIKKKASEFKIDNGEKVETDIGEYVQLANKSFLWTVSRIIHSIETMVQTEASILKVTQHRVYSEYKASYFSFRSDFDNENSMHTISIINLVNTYQFQISPEIEAAIQIRDPSL